MYCEIMSQAKGCYKTKQLANGIIALAIEGKHPMTFLRLSVYLFLVHGWSLALTDKSLFRESPMVVPWGVTYSSVLDFFLGKAKVDDDRLLLFPAVDYIDDNDLVHEPEAFVPDESTPEEQSFWIISSHVCVHYASLSDAELKEWVTSNEATSIQDSRIEHASFVPEHNLARQFIKVCRRVQPSYIPKLSVNPDSIFSKF